MKLKGHATIELTDVNTGEKVVHEDDNIITNAIKEMLRYNGALCNSGNYALNCNMSDLYSPLKRLTGGLLLFDSEIEENVETIYPPSGVSLVGCASGISYNGENIMAGSYNKSESGKIDGGYKHVWDFSTSQANGQIACACLTSMSGGKVSSGSYPFSTDYMYKTGESNDVAEETLFKDASLGFFATKCEDASYPEPFSLLFLDGKRNRMLQAKTQYWYYVLNKNSSTYLPYFQKSIFYNRAIDILVKRFPVNNFSIFDSLRTQGLATSAAYDADLIDEVHIEMPDGLKAVITDEMISTGTTRYFGLSFSSDDDYMYIIIKLAQTSSTDIVDKNEKLYIWKIDVGTFESTYFEVTNTTGESLWFQSNVAYNVSERGSSTVAVFDDKMICVGYSSKYVYCIDLNDNTNVSKITFNDGSIMLAHANYGLGLTMYQLGGKIFVSPYGGYSGNYALSVDTVAKKAGYKNISTAQLYGAGAYSSYVYKLMHVAGTLFNVVVNSSNYCQLVVVYDPSFLVTINNLSSPVLKTASQTMKVTYTLTQVVDE